MNRREVFRRVVKLVKEAKSKGIEDPVEVTDYVLAGLGDEIDWEVLIELIIKIIMMLLSR